MSDTRHLADLKFEERPLSPSTEPAEAAPKTAGLQTDMVMLQKADVWMSQFKTRLNVSIIALVVLWGSVSYFKSTEMRLEARTTPESILADGSVDDGLMIHAVQGDNLKREAPAEAVETEEAVTKLPEKTVIPAPIKTLKKTVTPKTVKNKAAGGNKIQSKNKKNLKKSLAAKSAS